MSICKSLAATSTFLLTVLVVGSYSSPARAITIDTNATYTLVGVQSGKCVDVAGGSTSSGTQLDIMPCAPSARQQFKMVDQGGGYYQVRNVNSGLCMDVSGASTADGAAVIQWTCGTGTNQQWSFTDSSGADTVRARHSGKLLDVSGANSADGTKLDQWSATGGSNQLFKLQAVIPCSTAPGSQIGSFVDPDTASPISPPNPPGITLNDTSGNRVNAHGGGIIKVCDTFYLHGEYFSSTSSDNNFRGFTMYSSKNLSTWKYEGMILPQQPSGLLGPNRKGERPHIIQCPATGEFVLYAHAADVTYQADKEVVYATSSTVNGTYSFKGALTTSSGAQISHSDMSAFTDGSNAYVITESGWIYTLSSDCHSWVSSAQYGAVNGTSGGIEAPTIFKAGGTYYWLGSSKTGWRANDNFYSTAPAITGPWTYRGYIAPQGDLTWMTQVTWVIPVVGSAGTTYLYQGDHWYGNQDTTAPGKWNYLATYVFQPIIFSNGLISLPTYNVKWKIDVGAGTWTTF